ncbi:MAG: acetyl-CoA carboxylase biotin carboxylase subunit [Myxococcales bacterium]|nr:acetyl-CoA carboxylase biotin carboxylase subunit [Myxococcales bacterium]
MPLSFRRVLIANRGEVAVRIARACDALGITPVLAVSEADKGAAYTEGRETVCLGPGRSAESYLDLQRVVQAAKQMRCSALHPGWGFLSENPRFAALCEAHGITFVGPPVHVMHLMGKKTPAKSAMKRAGLSVIPGSDGVLSSFDEAVSVADSVGYPVLIKAESGGGGRGMRIARSAEELEEAYAGASREAAAAFGDDRVYLERLLEGGRHVEIQIMADRYGNVCHLGERDCSVQRKHQKLIEESPSTALTPDERTRTTELAARAAASIGYVGAGTMEFLLDDSGTLRFMEMNTRLQVEHTVSEMRSGIDLAAEQLRVAAGHPLSFSQADVRLDGHAIECRINAEDPERDFRPSPGTISLWRPPAASEHVRVDTHVSEGYKVPPFYDSLICKLIVKGADRQDARKRMLAALGELRVEGIKTTAPMHIAVLESEAFTSGQYDTRSIPGWPAA